MEHEKTVTRMRMVGGHPCLDFVNTVDARVGTWGPDLLRNYDDLLAWAERVEVITPTERNELIALAADNRLLATKALERAKVLRESLYAILRAEALQTNVPPDEVNTVQKAVVESLRKRALCEANGLFFWGWTNDGSLEAVWVRVALSAASFLAGRHLRRSVRECPGPNCGWLFLDTSKAGRRRWCSDESCGSRSRVRRFRARV